MEMMLDDVKILDFTTNVAGPGASAMASDFGAKVIKIESQSGDSARTYAPFMDGKGMTHAWINRGKKSVVMNLKDPRHRGMQEAHKGGRRPGRGLPPRRHGQARPEL